MKGMGGGGAGEYSLKYYRAICFTRYIRSDQLLFIGGRGGGVEERFLEVTWFSGEPKGSVVAKRV